MGLTTERAPVRRIGARQPMNFARAPTQSSSPPPISKTKSAICFLCLFDGLRTPSIRRLVRKPRTICGKPMLTFDPSFYAPSSQKALRERYLQAIDCPCDVAVDPSVETALQLVKQHGGSIPPQRVLIHYYGQGCVEPATDGCLYFFTPDRSRYKPIKIINLMNTCACPLCFILDCPNAAALIPHLSSRRDLFAFFACSIGEKLPLSTQAPWDLFSSCLLSPFETAIWWYEQRHSSINPPPNQSYHFYQNSNQFLRVGSTSSDMGFGYSYSPSSSAPSSLPHNFGNFQNCQNYQNYQNFQNFYDKNASVFGNEESNDVQNGDGNEFNNGDHPNEEIMPFLKNFLFAILDAIFYDTQPPSVVELFTRDPAVRNLARGFVLSQRVMLSFDLHPQSLPELKPMASDRMWAVWDIAVDCGVTLPPSKGEAMIFDLFLKTFEQFPLPRFLPIFSFFIQVDQFSQIAADHLLNYIDKDPLAAEQTSKTGLPQAILDASKPTQKQLLILTKTIALSKIPLITTHTPLYFQNGSIGVLRAGMLCLTVAASVSMPTSFNKLIQLCLENGNPAECAPFSCILFGQLVEKAGRMMALAAFSEKFAPLLKSDRSDVRAAALFALAFSREKDVISICSPLLKDPIPFVRIQALYAVSQLSRLNTQNFGNPPTFGNPNNNSNNSLNGNENGNGNSQYIREAMGLVGDSDEKVKSHANSLLKLLQYLEKGGAESGAPKVGPNPLIATVVESVKQNGFVKRFEEDIFGIPLLGPQPVAVTNFAAFRPTM